jgi:hypothetical protein
MYIVHLITSIARGADKVGEHCKTSAVDERIYEDVYPANQIAHRTHVEIEA